MWSFPPEQKALIQRYIACRERMVREMQGQLEKYQGQWFERMGIFFNLRERFPEVVTGSDREHILNTGDLPPWALEVEWDMLRCALPEGSDA